jgi:hypothetical protein
VFPTLSLKHGHSDDEPFYALRIAERALNVLVVPARPENDRTCTANGFLTAFYVDDGEVELLFA